MMEHGTRRMYQQHACRCPWCRAANTAYQTSYRQAYRSGRPPLGAHIPGTEAAQLLTRFLEEGYCRQEVAQAQGFRRWHRWPLAHWTEGGATIRSTVRLRWLARQLEV